MGRTSLLPWFMGNKMQFEAVACRLFLHYSYTLAQKASNYGIFCFYYIFLNPFDGSIVPYYATDMEKRTVFPTVLSMLKSVDRSIYFQNQHLTEHYVALSKENRLPLLSGPTNRNECAIERASEIVYDKKMYQSSRIMRSMQYVFEGNVVRIWRDDLLGDAVAAIDASIF